MTIDDFIVHVFCLTDDFLSDYLDGQRLRERGPRPTVDDSVVLTCEVVGEFLDHDTDSGIFSYFRGHWKDFFPKLTQIHRTTFVRQAANLWALKKQLWQHVKQYIGRDTMISIIDSFPVPVCRFARAYRCKRLPEIASFGHDEMAKQTFYGLRGHLRIEWPGVIADFDVAPANVHDIRMARELNQEVQGWELGDRNYWSPQLIDELGKAGVALIAPHKKGRSPHWSVTLTQKRRRIETVIGQLCERFNAKQVWARDRWHLTNRWLRKIASHTIAVFLCQKQGLSPLRFSELIDD